MHFWDSEIVAAFCEIWKEELHRRLNIGSAKRSLGFRHSPLKVMRQYGYLFQNVQAFWSVEGVGRMKRRRSRKRGD
jgi:hypothetical protein